MTDHHLRTMELLDELTSLRVELAALHEKTPHRREQIAMTYDAIRSVTKVAEIHAHLAISQSVYDAAAHVVSQLQADAKARELRPNVVLTR